jgi:hypothetical protein
MLICMDRCHLYASRMRALTMFFASLTHTIAAIACSSMTTSAIFSAGMIITTLFCGCLPADASAAVYGHANVNLHVEARSYSSSSNLIHSCSSPLPAAAGDFLAFFLLAKGEMNTAGASTSCLASFLLPGAGLNVRPMSMYCSKSKEARYAAVVGTACVPTDAAAAVANAGTALTLAHAISSVALSAVAH